MPSRTTPSTSAISHDPLVCLIDFRGSCRACQLSWLRWLAAGQPETEFERLSIEDLIAASEFVPDDLKSFFMARLEMAAERNDGE